MPASAAGTSGAPPSGSGGAPSGGTADSAGAGGASSGALPPAGGNGSLKDKFANYFPIGAAVDANGPMTHGELLTKHFNSVTPENEMKFASLQPTEGQFTYGPADGIVDYAQRNGMKVRGHALVWHSQNPDWLWSGPGGGTVSKPTLLARMKAHIDAVARHFRGKVYCWDVVNEAVMNDGHLRGPDEPEGQKSRWLEIAGEEYIAEAFRYAHAADPDAKLFYNDFYNYIPAKQQAIYELMKKLLDAGVPVHGVGLQAHLNIEPSADPMNQAYYQHVENMEKAIQLYSSLGLEVQVTEMDMSLYIPGVTYTQDTFYTAATFTAELKARQAARYKAFFDMFRRYHQALTGVTLWGIADDNTWLSEFMSMRKDFPLLFDDRHATKPSYDSVMDW
jgi:endo-1,4-beta-xylanase